MCQAWLRAAEQTSYSFVAATVHVVGFKMDAVELDCVDAVTAWNKVCCANSSSTHQWLVPWRMYRRQPGTSLVPHGMRYTYIGILSKF